MPAVSYTLLDRHKSTTEALRGKAVLVSFWATNCAVCVADMPRIISPQRHFEVRDFDTLAVAMRYDAPANVARFAESHQLPFGVAIDDMLEIARCFGGIELTRTAFLLDERGNTVERYVGPPDFAALSQLIDMLLAEA